MCISGRDYFVSLKSNRWNFCQSEKKIIDGMFWRYYKRKKKLSCSELIIAIVMCYWKSILI